MAKTIQFHNTPAMTREFVNNWLTHARKDKTTTPAQIGVLEDLLQMCDVAMTVLQPGPADPGKDK
jgi:hypothetical protein